MYTNDFPYSYVTEKLASYLPSWMKMQRDPDTVGQNFLNVFGLEMEEIEEYLNELLYDHYLGTASVYQTDILYKYPLDALLSIPDSPTVTGQYNGQLVPITLRTSLRSFYQTFQPIEYSETIIINGSISLFQSHINTDSIVITDVDNIVRYDNNDYEVSENNGIIVISRTVDSTIPTDTSSLITYTYIPNENYHTAILDTNAKLLYTKFEYNFVVINNTGHFLGYLHHVWNTFDELGLLLGCPRLHGERNIDYKERLLDVFKNPGGATKTGLANALSRRLGVSKELIVLDSFNDKAFVDTLLNNDGSASTLFRKYIKTMNSRIPILWGSARWEEAYWDLVEEDMMGINYLPHIWNPNTSGYTSSDFQSGIGSDDDLLVQPPGLISDTQKFNYYVGLQGITENEEITTPEVSLQYSVQGKGKVISTIIQEERFYYTITAAENITLGFSVQAHKIYEKTTSVDLDDPDTVSGLTLSNVEIVPGNTITSISESGGQKYRYLKVIAKMQTTDNMASPKLNLYRINWNTTTGTNSLTFSTDIDFNNGTMVDTAVVKDANTTPVIPDDGHIELGKVFLSETLDWNESKAVKIRTTINENGHLVLVLPQQ